MIMIQKYCTEFYIFLYWRPRELNALFGVNLMFHSKHDDCFGHFVVNGNDYLIICPEVEKTRKNWSIFKNSLFKTRVENSKSFSTNQRKNTYRCSTVGRLPDNKFMRRNTCTRMTNCWPGAERIYWIDIVLALCWVKQFPISFGWHLYWQLSKEQQTKWARFMHSKLIHQTFFHICVIRNANAKRVNHSTCLHSA